MSVVRLNSLINMKHLNSLCRLNVELRQTGAPACRRFASNDNKQDSNDSSQNDQQRNQNQNQNNMQQQMQQSPYGQQGGFAQNPWCPCCCQPTSCYMPNRQMNPGVCSPFCGQQQQQMQMQMGNQMNPQMSNQQYPQFPPFMPMQAHCLPQFNPMESSYPCAMQDGCAMCSTFCPECRAPCQPNQTCPNCQGKLNMEAEADAEEEIAEEKPQKTNMPSGSAYTDLFDKKKPAETKE